MYFFPQRAGIKLISELARWYELLWNKLAQKYGRGGLIFFCLFITVRYYRHNPQGQLLSRVHPRPPPGRPLPGCCSLSRWEPG